MATIGPKLPQKFTHQIGRIISRWAFIEWKIKHLTYGLLDLDHGLGRLAVREPRVGDHITMIEEILAYRKLPPPIDLKPLKSRLIELQSWRDNLAHSAWILKISKDRFMLQITKGKWTPSTGIRPLNRKIRPQAAMISADDLKLIADKIDREHQFLDKIIRQISSALRASGIASPKIFASLKIDDPSKPNRPRRNSQARKRRPQSLLG